MLEKKQYVKKKFSNIHERYDFLNSLLSFGVDSYWRKYVVSQLDDIPKDENAILLDLCAGTMPLTVAINNRYPRHDVISLDFCEEMLVYGLEKKTKDNPRIIPICGDALQLPFLSDTFSAVTVAFGVRNFSDVSRGIGEIFRVLKKGGKLIILEFSQPTNAFFNFFYKFYLNNILPSIAGVISGDGDAYRYLAKSINAFYKPNELKSIMEQIGFVNCSYSPLTMGIVYVHCGYKV